METMLSFYERQPKGCDAAEGVFGIALGVLTLFTQPSIEAVVSRANGTQPSPASWVTAMLTVASYLLYIALFIWLKKMQGSALDGWDDKTASLNERLADESERRRQAEVLKACSDHVLWGVATLARRNAQIANDAVHSIQERGVSELPARGFDDVWPS